MNSYVELVRQRLADRHNNILANIDKLPDWNLRFTVRIFGDCLDEDARKELLGSYSEYRTESELREFLREFLPAYGEYAIAELIEKKKDGENFDPPCLTQEEYQEMALREKWPKIAARLDDVAPLQLRREIARAAMLFRPYMISDPGFNEGVLEFALYFDLMDRLAAVGHDELKEAAAGIATLLDRAASARAPEESERLLREVRTRAAGAAGVTADLETLLGPEMERYPREAPPEWKLRELRKTLDAMSLKDLRLSALAHLELITALETREIVSPFFSRYASFYEIPSSGLKELILAVAEEAGSRILTGFIDRYATGAMAMTKPVAHLVWKLMPEGEKLEILRRDNAALDATLMSRHLARFLHAGTPGDLVDMGRQIALLTDQTYLERQGLILKMGGREDAAERLRRLYDEVTLLALRMMSAGEPERGNTLQLIRGKIAVAAGIDGESIQGGE